MENMRKEISYCVCVFLFCCACLSMKIDICYLGQFTAWNVYFFFFFLRNKINLTSVFAFDKTKSDKLIKTKKIEKKCHRGQ